MQTRYLALSRLVAGFAAFALTAVALGQTVKQGDPNAPPVDPTEFHSPMVVETIFAPADPSLWKNEEWTPQKPKPWKRGTFTVPEYHDLVS